MAVKGHVSHANGPDAPPGVRLSWQAVLIIIAGLTGAWTGEDYLEKALFPPAQGVVSTAEYRDMVLRLQRLENWQAAGGRYTAEMALQRERNVNEKFELLQRELAQIRIEMERIRK